MFVDPLGLSTQSENPWGWMYGSKISAHVPDGGITSARAVPAPAMVRPAASPIAASAPANFLLRFISRSPVTQFPPATGMSLDPSQAPWNRTETALQRPAQPSRS